ncbi:hypothetical protein MW368_000347 [Acinetobacter baumannii]|nr:hypothetical protein [Acinetobacter baumannii]
MTDLNKGREAFLGFLRTKGVVKVGWNSLGVLTNLVREAGCTLSYNDIELMQEVWMEKAKAQAVQQSFEIGRLQDRITELLDERQDLYAQINNDQAVPDTQQKLTDTYYLEGSDYVVDCPFEYDIEIDKGEVLELQKWQRTESTKVYFANIYEDEDNFEILQFASKAEAENAVAENLKFLEASESGAEE